MKTVNIHEAKTHLSRLVDEAERGQSTVIAKAGKPKAKLVPIDNDEDVLKKRIGFMKGMYTLPDNFDEIDRELDKEIEELFYGKDEQ